MRNRRTDSEVRQVGHLQRLSNHALTSKCRIAVQLQVQRGVPPAISKSMMQSDSSIIDDAVIASRTLLACDPA